MTFVTLANDKTGSNIKGRKQRRGAVANIIMGLAFRTLPASWVKLVVIDQGLVSFAIDQMDQCVASRGFSCNVRSIIVVTYFSI